MPDLPANPFTAFSIWYADALSVQGESARAMALGTVSPKNLPDVRMILLKQFDESSGFTFFTNRESPKGLALDFNPVASLCFYWGCLGKQVRVFGNVIRTSDKISDQYFSTRARMSQISAWASDQSFSMPDEETLTDRVASYKEKFGLQNIPRPPKWGGYTIIPTQFEFWMKGEFRMNKRVLFTKRSGLWIDELLFP